MSKKMPSMQEFELGTTRHGQAHLWSSSPQASENSIASPAALQTSQTLANPIPNGTHSSRGVMKLNAANQQAYQERPGRGLNCNPSLQMLKDPYGRPIRHDLDPDRLYFFGPEDAKLRPLVVQSGTKAVVDCIRILDDPEYPRSRLCIWSQSKLQNKTPRLIRSVYWAFSPVVGLVAPMSTHDVEIGAVYNKELRSWNDLTWVNWVKLAGRYFVGSLFVMVLLHDPRQIEGQIRNHGNYDPIQYRNWGYAKAARNPQEQEGYEAPRITANAQPTTNFGQPQLAGLTTISNPSQETLTSDSQSSSGCASALAETSRPQNQTTPRPPPAAEIERLLLPKYLCFRTDHMHNFGRRDVPYETLEVTEWIKRHPDAGTGYVFVSYTRAQFYTHSDEEVKHWDMSAHQRTLFERQRTIDKRHLINFGRRAARKANVPAFWIDFECIDTEDVTEYKILGNNANEIRSVGRDAYRICDASRAAHSMIIVLGPRNPKNVQDLQPVGYHSDICRNQNILETQRLQKSIEEHNETLKEAWLYEWGSRLWTLPEILLAPGGKLSIEVVAFNEHKAERLFAPINAGPCDGKTEEIFKRNFAVRGYAREQDRILVGSLIDHYEGSLIMTTLEFVTTALEVLWTRDTSIYLKGDVSYALMALLRRRPEVNPFDEEFEAFTRLSLANDSNRLLERLICLLPETFSHKPCRDWRSLNDAWSGVKLWDIEPGCQIAGIVDNRTVLIDGAFGASINWESLSAAEFIKRQTTFRTVMKIVIRIAPLWLPTAIVSLANTPELSYQISSTQNISLLLVINIIIIIFGFCIIFLSPWLLLNLYRGKFWSVQAWFFGIEGYVDLGIIEGYLFGYNHNRLKWSVNGSMLSRHRQIDGECVGLPPDLENWEEQQRLRGGTERLFTLVDTYTMTATMFWAERPPVAVMICGSEGGMQRAVLCSYDWKTATFCRETVLRMKTIVLEKIFRVDKFRFAVQNSA